MYSTTCKMNHSCCPNIVAKYVFSCSSGGAWGENFPMTIQCVALRDIKEGEELCISYISNDQPFEQRQEALANYGFECNCSLCLQKKSRDNVGISKDVSNNFGGLEDNIFGKDEEIEHDLFGEESEGDDDASAIIDTYDADSAYSDDSWEDILNKRMAKLDLLPRPSGIIPLRIIVPASSFVVQVGNNALQEIGVKGGEKKYGKSGKCRNN